jgi:hypothetical protein
MWVIRNRSFMGADGIVDSVTTYLITALGTDGIRGKIPGEKRLSPSGAPVAWELLRVAPHEFAWHRTDWEPGAVTKSLLRCAPNPPGARLPNQRL